MASAVALLIGRSLEDMGSNEGSKINDWSGKANQSTGHESLWKKDELGWYHKYCLPISDLLWTDDLVEAQKAISKGRKVISQGKVSGQDAGCMAAQLRYMEYLLGMVKWSVTPPEERDPDFWSQNENIIKATLTPQEDLKDSETYQFQIRLYLLACCGNRNKPTILSEEKFLAWFGQVGQQYLDDEFWTLISFWAYDNCYLDILEQAYDFLLYQGAGFYSEYSFKRVELMLKLRRGIAEEEDLLNIIKLPEVKRQLESIKIIFFKESTKQGLWSPGIDRFYEDYLLELSHNNPKRVSRLIDSDE